MEKLKLEKKISKKEFVDFVVESNQK